MSGPSSHSTRGRKRTLVSFRFGLHCDRRRESRGLEVTTVGVVPVAAGRQRLLSNIQFGYDPYFLTPLSLYAVNHRSSASCERRELSGGAESSTHTTASRSGVSYR